MSTRVKSTRRVADHCCAKRCVRSYGLRGAEGVPGEWLFSGTVSGLALMFWTAEIGMYRKLNKCS